MDVKVFHFTKISKSCHGGSISSVEFVWLWHDFVWQTQWQKIKLKMKKKLKVVSMLHDFN